MGDAPIRFLRTSRSTAGWALDRSPAANRLFTDRFGPLSTPIGDFTTGPGAHVRLVDLSELAPDVMNRLVEKESGKLKERRELIEQLDL